jgi:hypothetical protein
VVCAGPRGRGRRTCFRDCRFSSKAAGSPYEPLVRWRSVPGGHTSRSGRRFRRRPNMFRPLLLSDRHDPSVSIGGRSPRPSPAAGVAVATCPLSLKRIDRRCARQIPGRFGPVTSPGVTAAIRGGLSRRFACGRVASAIPGRLGLPGGRIGVGNALPATAQLARVRGCSRFRRGHPPGAGPSIPSRSTVASPVRLTLSTPVAGRVHVPAERDGTQPSTGSTALLR